MSTQVEESIAQVLTKNVDLFTWLAFDMLGTDPEYHYQPLTICPKARLIAQRKRKLNPKRTKFVDEKEKKLLNTGFIREEKYTSWLANVVMVNNSKGK